MPRIAGVATASPPNALTQEKVKSFATRVSGENHGFTEVNDRYIKSALELSEKTIHEVAETCQLSTHDFDVIFFISTTGLSTPSLDARLFNRIPMNPHIKRIPIWGLGCAAGASAIARAHDYLKAFPTHRALIVSVELCGLAFQSEEQSKENLIATALFGDGASACVMVGDEVKIRSQTGSHPSVLGSFSTIYPDSNEVMSWRITHEGFKVRLSRDIPSIVHSLVKEDVVQFLSRHSLSLQDIEHFVMHPGEMNVVHAYAEALSIPVEKLRHSIEVLQHYGNMSSTTIFFILKRFLETTHNQTLKLGLLSALGPGFSSELVLLEWN